MLYLLYLILYKYNMYVCLFKFYHSTYSTISINNVIHCLKNKVSFYDVVLPNPLYYTGFIIVAWNLKNIYMKGRLEYIGNYNLSTWMYAIEKFKLIHKFTVYILTYFEINVIYIIMYSKFIFQIIF